MPTPISRTSWAEEHSGQQAPPRGGLLAGAHKDQHGEQQNDGEECVAEQKSPDGDQVRAQRREQCGGECCRHAELGAGQQIGQQGEERAQ